MKSVLILLYCLLFHFIIHTQSRPNKRQSKPWTFNTKSINSYPVSHLSHEKQLYNQKESNFNRHDLEKFPSYSNQFGPPSLPPPQKFVEQSKKYFMSDEEPLNYFANNVQEVSTNGPTPYPVIMDYTPTPNTHNNYNVTENYGSEEDSYEEEEEEEEEKVKVKEIPVPKPPSYGVIYRIPNITLKDHPTNFLNLAGTDFQPGRLVNIWLVLCFMMYMLVSQGYKIWLFGMSFRAKTELIDSIPYSPLFQNLGQQAQNYIMQGINQFFPGLSDLLSLLPIPLYDFFGYIFGNFFGFGTLMKESDMGRTFYDTLTNFLDFDLSFDIIIEVLTSLVHIWFFPQK